MSYISEIEMSSFENNKTGEGAMQKDLLRMSKKELNRLEIIQRLEEKFLNKEKPGKC